MAEAARQACGQIFIFQIAQQGVLALVAQQMLEIPYRLRLDVGSGIIQGK